MNIKILRMRCRLLSVLICCRFLGILISCSVYYVTYNTYNIEIKFAGC